MLCASRNIIQIVVSVFCVCLFLVFEEPEDPSNRSFFSEIISSISDVKFSHSGRYMMTRDYLSVKIWDLNMENRPVETYQVFTVFSFNDHIPCLSVYREGFCSMCNNTVFVHH